MQDDAIKQWLAPADPSTDYNTARKARHKDTEFISLQGKTVLSSTIVQDLQENSKDTVLYFYISFANNQKQSLGDIIRSLTIQLYYNQPEAQQPILSLYSNYDRGVKQPGLDSLQRTFQQMLLQAGDVYTVIDALDEYKSRSNCRSELLAWLKGFSKGLGNVYLLVTSRPEADIKSSIESWVRAENIISLYTDQTGRDIAEYIHAEVATSEELVRWKNSPDVQEQIEKALNKMANGVFRGVACQLKRLKDCTNIGKVKRTLESLPETLEETYTLELNGLNSNWREETYRLLQFLAHSERPLRIEEAMDALAVDLAAKPGLPRFKKEARMPEPADISKFCSTLITVVEKRDWEERVVSELQLAHSSVKEYLKSRSETQFAGAFVEPTARAVIARVCLAYLLELEPRQPIRQLLDLHYLARFSARYWAEHASKVDGGSTAVYELAMELFAKASIFQICYQLYDPEWQWEWSSTDDWRLDSQPLHYASLCGLIDCVNGLINIGADVNAQGGRYRNALQSASAGGHLEITQLLLIRGADINGRGGEYGNALQAASAKGHLDIVQLLLDRGANINVQGGDYGNALQAASAKGYLEIVQLLLDRGADINARGGYLKNALYAASAEGQLGIVRLLLNRGADINAQGEYFENALYAASVKERLEIVQLLLDRGANVNIQNRYLKKALSTAPAKRHLELVQLLLN